MTAQADPGADPYVLPLPRPEGPVVLAKWISPGNRHPNSHYQDAFWALGPLIDNPASTRCRIFWRNCPPPLQGQLKLIAWTMINGELRPTYLHDRGVQARARTSAGDMYSTCNEWMRLARWLHQSGVTDLGDCTTERWRSFIGERLAGLSRTTAVIVCGRLTDLWAFDQLSAAPTGIAPPPWQSEGVDDFLPAADGGHVENTTEPLDPQVLGPLLTWSIRFVDDFADDILTAFAERRRLIDLAAAGKATTTTWAALEDLLLPMLRDAKALPASTGKHKASLSRQYLAARTGASVGQIARFALQHNLTALGVVFKGQIQSRIEAMVTVAW
ncbi:hypothetical protein [Kitasatospora cineracea]|uniref:hypothetical protein n=1 Tax=Kitasatospora cineracea TaxID=88074 RepID=UPI0034108FD6